MDSTDVVCIGAGGVGSAALWQLAQRGVKAVGIDRFPPAHDRGSSHGRTRVIRLAYFEHPDYVPLLRRSYELWRELEAASGADLYQETGLLEVGPPDGEIVGGVRRAAIEHGLPISNLTAEEIPALYPGFAVDADMEGVFEERAGILQVEKAIAAQLHLAQTKGIELRTGITVNSWRADGEGVVVDTNEGPIAADRLIITAGAWAPDLLGDLGIPLQIRRKSLFWFPAEPEYGPDSGCPLFFYDTPGGRFYGFPAEADLGLKVANHSGGQIIDDPLQVDRSLRLDDQREVAEFLQRYLPGVHATQPTDHAVCMYTDTPDGHFVVDHHREHSQVSFVAGLSGHGFKMAPALGEVLADYATSDTEATSDTDDRVEFLAADRPGLAEVT
jgi:sarcosine oxidase